MFFFVLFAVCLFYWFHVKDRRTEKLIDQFPGPPAHPIFGNLFNYFTTDLPGLFSTFRSNCVVNERFNSVSIHLPFFRIQASYLRSVSHIR